MTSRDNQISEDRFSTYCSNQNIRVLMIVILVACYIYFGPRAISKDQQLFRVCLIGTVAVMVIALSCYRLWKNDQKRRACTHIESTSTLWFFKSKHSCKLVMCILLVHALLLSVQAYRNAPTIDEVGHLPSGLFHWQYGNFDLYCVNPPIVRMIGTIPLLLSTDVKTDWSLHRHTPFWRGEFVIGQRFISVNGKKTFWFFTLSRLAIIPIMLLGALATYLFASELYGDVSGLVALTLWTFCPQLLAWGAQITPDGASASLGVIATWLYSRWLNRPNYNRMISAGIWLGVAELSKFTWIILFVLWPILCLMHNSRRNCMQNKSPRLSGVACIILIAIYVLNLGYLFEGTMKPLGEYAFISEALGGDGAHLKSGNRFRSTLLGKIPIPLPENYLRGIDMQKYEFERGKWSFLRGEFKKGGWWYYYLYVILVKTPEGFLIIGALAFFLTLHPAHRLNWNTEALVFVPAIAIIVIVSSQTGFNRYGRYVVPALPFLYIFASRSVRILKSWKSWATPIYFASLSVGIGSSLSTFPYSMSYFNSLGDGPIGGKHHLLDANIDWGQDLLELSTWLDINTYAKPIHLAYFGSVNPELAGIDFQLVPLPPAFSVEGELAAPIEGWYAISVNYLMGYPHDESDSASLTYFQCLEPIATIGYSIYIFHIGEKEIAELSRLFRESEKNLVLHPI